MLISCLVLLSAGVRFSCSENSTIKETLPQNDVEVKGLGEYLVDLDGKILRMLILPESGGGDQLLKYLENYWKKFRYLDGLVVLSEQVAFRPAKYMLEQECPKFVQEAFDVFNLQQTYKWDSEKFATFREYLLLIAGLAGKFPDDFSKMRVDVETLFEKPLQHHQ